MTNYSDPFVESLFNLSLEIAEKVRPVFGAEPAISVIIPCFDSANFLRPCLESLRLQTLPQGRFEVICVDDCSADTTLEVIGEYHDRIDNLRVIRHETNRKQGAARNTGLDAARGRFVLFLDSDDFLRVDALEVLLNLIGTTDIAICQHITTRFDKPHKRTVSNRHVRTSLGLAAMENTIGWWPFGMLISRGLLNSHGIRFREGVYFEDIDFNINVFLKAKSHSVTKEALYYYIERDGSTVNLVTEKKLMDSVAVIAHVADQTKAMNRAEEAAFFKRASFWLTLQARRIRDSDLPLQTRAALARAYVQGIEKAKLFPKLDAGTSAAITATAISTPARVAHDDGPVSEGFRYNPFPVDFREEFKDKVIFFCEVNYHIRSVAPVARILKTFGIDSIIIDASRSTSFTSNRPLADDELPLFADVDLRPFNVAETLPFATDAAAFVFMNDTTYTKRLIFENFGFGVPTFGFYEGINDDWNLDRKSPRMPYRSVDCILLPGIYQQGFYLDRASRIVGLPNVRNRLAVPFEAPVRRRAIINVNFTYGVLEDRRDDYVTTAVRACEEIGLDYVITQHPADKADLSQYKVGKDSVYDLLAEGTVLISRFSTTILEALSMGRPAIYHNPIAEKVPKFSTPLGAYSTSSDVASLKQALKRELAFVEQGGDVRARAQLFLHFHANTGAAKDPDTLAAEAIAAVLADPPVRFAFKAGAGDFVTPRPNLLAKEALIRAGVASASGTGPKAIPAVASGQPRGIAVSGGSRLVDLELDQLRQNFVALSTYAGALDKQLGGGLTAPVVLGTGEDLIDRLKSAVGPSSARLLLTSVGSELLFKPAEMQRRIAQDGGLAAAIRQAFEALDPDDAHRLQFLRVQQRRGI